MHASNRGRRRLAPAPSLLLTLLVSGCSGSITPTGRDGDDDRGADSRNGGSAAGGVEIDPHDFDSGPGLRRLGRNEFANTVFDLLGVTVKTEALPRELVVLGHGHIAGAQKTGYDDSDSYLDLGDGIAGQAASKLATEIDCADAACFRTWARGFLTRAFRGPVPDALLDRYAAMLTSTDAGGDTRERLQTFLVATLTSPHFLYRKEIGKPVSNRRELDAYEIASRLSYLVWQSMPDAQLLADAAADRLRDVDARLNALTRLLADPRARRGLRGFVSDWMGVHENHLPKKAPQVLQDTGTDFPAVAERGFEMLVEDVLSASDKPRFSELLTVEHAFANATLAKVMGAKEMPSDFARVTLDPSQRRGILTQPLVIAAHSKESGASPFPVGKFIYENLLCQRIPPPPASFPTVEDAPGSTQTLRQKLESMTMVEPCFSCHRRIGPPGFAFLPFDPVGRFENRDASGQPFDTRGTLIDGDGNEGVAFDGAADLAVKLAKESSVQTCIARRFFRFTFGRFENESDRAGLNALEKQAVASDAGVVELLRALVQDPAFTQVRID